MPQLSRVGDTNQTKGAIVGGAQSVLCNGLPVGQQGNKITPHHPYKGPHNSATVSDGSPSVFAEGIAVARVGSGNSCGHSMVQGSPDVFVP